MLSKGALLALQMLIAGGGFKSKTVPAPTTEPQKSGTDEASSTTQARSKTEETSK